MIGTIRKHSKWMWWVIIVAIIITFVYWGSAINGPRGGSRGGRGNFGVINGETISQSSFFDAQREVMLSHFFATGEWPDGGRKNPNFDLEREIWFRLLLIQKQNELGIVVGDEAVAKTAAERMRALNRGNPVPLDAFVKNVLAPKNLTLEDFQRFVRHDVGVQQLIAVSSLGGNLVTPQEIRAFYEREHQELSVQAVFFPATNYLAGITVPPGALSNYFELQSAQYRLPERVQVNYVKFAATNFLTEARALLGQVTNLEARIEAEYQQRGSNYFADAKSPAEAKEKIRELALNEAALTAARKQALAFAAELFDQKPVAPDTLVTFAKAKGLTPLVSPPFDREEPPAGFEVRADFLRAAFALSADEPYSQPLVGNDGVYVISLNKKLPSEIPAFESIRDRVTQDYRFREAVMAARQAGLSFYTTASNALAAGKAFAGVCSEANVRPVLPPPFSISSRTIAGIEGRVSLPQFKQAAFSTPPGQVSNFNPTSDGGFLVFVKEKLPLDEVRMKADLAEFSRAVRQTRKGEAFNEWFRREAEKGFKDVPYFHQQQSQLTGAPKK
jgi:peptidyl-prolyl cis-trans isomerase D